MNADTFEGKWKQMRGELRSWWGKLSDNDLEKIAGKKDRLVGALQEKYGYTRDAAQQEIDRHFREYDERMGMPGLDKKEQTTSGTSSSVMSKASQPISAVGEKIESLAGVIREKAPHEGAAATAATAVADKLNAAGSYLQEKNLDHVVGDLSSMIRRHPVPSLLIGLGIGFLLARGTRR